MMIRKAPTRRRRGEISEGIRSFSIFHHPDKIVKTRRRKAASIANRRRTSLNVRSPKIIGKGPIRMTPPPLILVRLERDASITSNTPSKISAKPTAIMLVFIAGEGRS